MPSVTRANLWSSLIQVHRSGARPLFAKQLSVWYVLSKLLVDLWRIACVSFLFSCRDRFLWTSTTYEQCTMHTHVLFSRFFNVTRESAVFQLQYVYVLYSQRFQTVNAPSKTRYSHQRKSFAAPMAFLKLEY